MSAKCAQCGTAIEETAYFIGGSAVCNQACGEALLASMPKEKPREFPKTRQVTQLPMALAWKQRQNFVAFDGGRIVVQACDLEYAHVGVFLGKKTGAYYHINLPGLERQKEPGMRGLNVVTPDEFDEIISKHRAELTNVLARLNATEG